MEHNVASFTIPSNEAPAMHAAVPESYIRSMSHEERKAYLSGLDPQRDSQQLAYLTACYEFPWDITRSLELALFRVFGVAKGTPLLVQTGEFVQRTQKRYDDTVLILSEILENGYDNPRGQAALARMNKQHGRFTIPNDEYVYTLSTFIFEPIRWMEQFGRRPMSDTEKSGSFYFWSELGRRMGIRDLPPTYEAFEAFNRAYEQAHFAYSDDNKALALATRNLMLSWVLPRFLQPVGAPFVHALIDDALLNAVGLPAPPAWLRQWVRFSMRSRAALLRLLPPRRKARLLTRMRNRTYPAGYNVKELGAARG